MPSTWSTRLVRPEIRALSAYHVASSTGMVKLDAMENPYTWPEDMKQLWCVQLQSAELNRYPDPHAEAVQHALRAYLNLPDGLGLMLGNGSDELIQIMAMALAQKKSCVLAPEPGFVMYRMIAEFVGMDYVGVPLMDDFSLDMGQMLRAIQRHDPALIFLAYPNNPTGNLWRKKHLRKIIEASPGLVVIDEAYAPFSEKTFIDEVANYPNVVLMRTVSKMGLAGLRLGYLVGHESWLAEFDKLRLPYNINVLSQLSTVFALQHREEFDRQAAMIREQRERLAQALDAMPGIEVFPSQANFLLFRTPQGQAQTVFDGLLARKILIKNLAPQGGLLADCLRVTVGSDEENGAFLTAMSELLSA